jgi:glycosyltransferase involved in cell wall biosynthesis
MRVLMLNWKDTAASDAGGAELYMECLARAWARKGETVTVLTPGRGTSVDGHGIHRMGVGNRLTVFPLARRHLAQHRADYDVVLEAVSTRPFLAHRVVGRSAWALYMQTAEAVWDREFPFPISWLGRLVIEPRWIRAMRSGRVMAISPSTMTALQRFGVPVVAWVPPGVDTPPEVRHRAAPAIPPRILFIGRLVQSKRPLDALTAFRRIAKALPGAHLDVVGDGYLRQRMAALDVPNVTIHGHVDNATKESLLDEADLLLFPATLEGWGIVAMEAAAYGVPVVAYDVPGVRDAVVSGTTGVLTASTPVDLADAAISLLGDQPRWAKMSQDARHRAEQHSWEQIAERIWSIVTA